MEASDNIMKVCRLCLTMDTKMYNISKYNLHQVFINITGLSVTLNSNFPQSLCWECTQRLRSAENLRLKAETSHNLLLDLFQLEKVVTLEHIKSINRYSYGLQSSLASKINENDNFDLTIDGDEKVFEEKIEVNLNEDVFDDLDQSKPIEVKVESNEIFFEDCGFVSEDDRTLSEVCKVKKVKKVKVKKKVKKDSEKLEEDDATTVADKFKTTDVKRRRTNENIDENLFTITMLSYEQQIEQITKRKESVLYKNATYKCELCFRGFHIKARYDAHSIRHRDESGAFECFICKSRLKTSRALRKHITSQHTEQFSCRGCPFITMNRGVAREHEKWHSGAKYQCPHCPSQFDKVTTYLGHVRIKHVSDFVCELCGYTFLSKKGIEVHKKKKHRLSEETAPLEGPYCELCDVRFVSEEAHLRHLKLSSKHSSDNDPDRIRNDSQSMSSMKKGVMRRTDRRMMMHRRDDDENPAELITCEQCGAQLRGLRLYAQHFRRVHPDKNRTKYPAMKTPSMCEQCGRIFQSMALLKDHMWVHTGEKRFKCDRCDKSFTQKTNLVFHMRVHSATRPTYECPLCGKHFAFYNNRRRHMFIHTGLKPFKCETCGKAFTTSGELRAHVEHVHLKKPWPKRSRRGNEEPWKCMQSMED
ncbi:zinc finger protein 260 isoform X1 [Pieris rapae]|uniref:zinc finger protein 260 isoform X1 n=1 Tax=Pieris rapae TaxID=64459 RepID=UPI001E27C789|nr:zinc finger protein 260 isoform X1 [Pieris rapae]XP_045489141.1 zinc finger protein 260 isoform X1 [Pieris rapae]XP_045489142.1 zinc finger protein 260 isoform X1 [Pieris rapae]